MLITPLLFGLAALEPMTARPVLHYTPEKNWINDPNGLVYADGEYHLFAQYNPHGDQWGHMSWAHAVSKDLFTWEHLPVAIPEVGPVMAFSGSAIIDHKNTSGFGTNANPPMVAIYTGHRTDKPHQSQYIAFSTDRGRTFTTYDKNPVLDLSMADFRDPKVFWHDPSKQWVMVVALCNEKQAGFFGSPDLKSWTKLSAFGPAGQKNVPNFECPDIFELPVDGDPKNTKWVLVASSGGNGPTGGVGVQYFVGGFDGKTFTNDNPADKVLWVDHGMDFYAFQSYADAPKGERIGLAWMANAHYAGATPTTPWRGAMTLPRTYGLKSTPDGVRITQRPVAQLADKLKGLGASKTTVESKDLAAPVDTGVRTSVASIDVELEVSSGSAGILFHGADAARGAVVGYDANAKALFIDRSTAERTEFAGNRPARFTAPLAATNGRVKFTVVIDHGSIEAFSEDGTAAITSLHYPRGPVGVTAFADGKASLKKLDALAVP